MAARRSRGEAAARIALDAAMAVALVLVMATALVAGAPHEFLGVALVVLAVAHVVVNRRWFAALGRGRWTPVRVLQAVAVAGLAVCVVGQAASAAVLSKHALAFLPAVPGSAVARRVHTLCAYWAFVFAFSHAGLQAKSAMRRLGAGSGTVRSAAKWAARFAVAVMACFGVVSFAQLDLPAYLTGQVQFAFGNPDVPLVCARWASVAVLISASFHCLRIALDLIGGKRKSPPISRSPSGPMR